MSLISCLSCLTSFSGFSFNPSAINLFPVDLPVKVSVVISSESVMVLLFDLKLELPFLV